MPRPRPKKIVTARPAPIARHHSTTSIKSGLTVNGPVNDEAPITASGDELPRQTRLGSRLKRTLSKKSPSAKKSVARQDQESEARMEKDVSGGEDLEEGREAVTETLVQATPEEVLVRLEQDDSATNVMEAGNLDAPSTGGRSKRLKEKAADVVRRVSSRRQSRHASGPAAFESQAEPEEHIPSSPPLYAQAPASVARIQATPSFLTNFRKQPRQPSILRMVQQSVGVLGSDDEDLTFDDETDPLADITTTTAHTAGQSMVQDDEGLYDEDVPPVLSSSSRKRKASALDPGAEGVVPSSILGMPVDDRRDKNHLPSDPASLPEMAQVPSDPTDELSPDDSASHKAARSSPPLGDNPQSDALPSPRKNIRPRRPGRVRGQKSTAKLVLPVIHSSSSIIEASSPHSTPPSSPINTQAQQAQQQKSKATTATRKGSKREKVVAVTTAALQALLPKRKVEKTARIRDTFDIHSSSTEPSNEDEEIDEEEDELSRPRRRAQPPQPSRAKPGALKSPKAVRGKAAGRILMTKSVTTKQARAKQSPAKAPSARVSKTYARQSRGEQENDEEDANVDKEQEDDVDVTIVTADGQVQGGELKNVRKKFEQVDQWELEFESADVGGDSSPWR